MAEGHSSAIVSPLLSLLNPFIHSISPSISHLFKTSTVDSVGGDKTCLPLCNYFRLLLNNVPLLYAIGLNSICHWGICCSCKKTSCFLFLCGSEWLLFKKQMFTDIFVSWEIWLMWGCLMLKSWKSFTATWQVVKGFYQPSTTFRLIENVNKNWLLDHKFIIFVFQKFWWTCIFIKNSKQTP